MDVSKNSQARVTNVRITYLVLNTSLATYPIIIEDSADRNIAERRLKTVNPRNIFILSNQYLFGITGFSNTAPMGVSAFINTQLEMSYGSTNPNSRVNAISYTAFLMSRPAIEYCSNCPNSFLSGNRCVPCPANSAVVNNSCVCNPGYNNFSGNCYQCPSATQFNPRTLRCD